jgi:hypothetical protein
MHQAFSNAKLLIIDAAHAKRCGIEWEAKMNRTNAFASYKPDLNRP